MRRAQMEISEDVIVNWVKFTKIRFKGLKVELSITFQMLWNDVEKKCVLNWNMYNSL